MSAPDNWRKGSFRGVPFFWTEGGAKPGRRTVQHDYPQRDDAYIEDMGRKAREFSLQVYVLGDDYISQRDALEGACDQPGPGTLVHPTRGEMQVCCTGCEVSESTRERRRAGFSLTFVLAGENLLPHGTRDTRAQVTDEADAAQIIVTEDFEKTFSVAGMPAFVADEAAALLGDVAGGMAEILAGPARVVGKGANLTNTALSIRSNASSLVQMPNSLSSQVMSLVSRFALLGSGQGAAAKLRPLARLGSFGQDLPSIAPTTTARRQQAANQSALVLLVRQASAVEAARLVPSLDFDSYDDAAETRRLVTDRLDAERAVAGDRTFRVLTALHAAVVRDTTARGGSRARLSTVQTDTTLPAVVVAHRLLGDASRADDLVTRNKIRNRLFVPGGVPLEVLNGDR